MSAEATPAPAHEPPSLPASPLPKRTKFVEASTASVASILNDNAPTPTPQNNTIEALSTDPTSTNLPSLNTMDPPPPPLQVKLLSETAKAPTRGSAHAAGYDLYAAKAAKIPARGKAMIDTDISIAVPAGTYGRVAPRSGLASKHSIDTGAGVIDADYRGPVKVLLFNFGENEFSVEAGDRIAQLIVERIYTPEIVVVEQLDETVRGAGGFGSTGGFGGTLPGINGVTGAVPSPATLPGA